MQFEYLILRGPGHACAVQHLSQTTTAWSYSLGVAVECLSLSLLLWRLPARILLRPSFHLPAHRPAPQTHPSSRGYWSLSATLSSRRSVPLSLVCSLPHRPPLTPQPLVPARSRLYRLLVSRMGGACLTTSS